MAMRAVLLSPVIVLVFWSIGAMIFSKNVNQKSNNKYNNRMNSRGRNNQRMTAAMMESQASNMYMLAPRTYGMAAQPVRQMGSNIVAPMYGEAQNNQMNQNMVTNPLLADQQMQMMPQLSNNMVVQPSPLQTTQQELPAMMIQGKLMEPKYMIPASPMQEQPQVVLQASYPEVPQLLQPPVTLPVEQPQVMQEQQLLALSPEAIVVPDPLGSGTRPMIHQPPHMRGSTGGATLLYYDPMQTFSGENGQVHLPSTVYDAQGNSIDLASLASQNQVQILVEPPRQQSQPLHQGVMKEEQPLIELPVIEQAVPEAQMAVPDIKKWGESTSQDQSIIVGTVAVMAMLVGALSARRLRSRSVLSACIENESLEDDAAYDAAYSTTMPQHNDIGSSYNTFGGGVGWKGDLEKFDV
jgi:hypothetical protein